MKNRIADQSKIIPFDEYILIARCKLSPKNKDKTNRYQVTARVPQCSYLVLFKKNRTEIINKITKKNISGALLNCGNSLFSLTRKKMSARRIYFFLG